MAIRDLIKTNHMYHYKEQDANDISEKTYKEIVRYVIDMTGHEVGTIVGNTWVDENNKYPGKLPSRIDQYFKNHYGHGISSEMKKVIGDTAQNGMVKGGTYNFMFDTKIEWKAGEFGDDDACFIKGGLSPQVIALRNNEAYAVQFFDDAGKGLARCWCIFLDNEADIRPIEYKKMYEEIIVLCNAYNKGMGLNLSRQSKIVAAKLGFQLAEVTAYRSGNGSFYTNGNNNIALYTGEEIPLKTVAFTLSDTPPVVCHICKNKRQLFKTIKNNNYCRECYEKNYFECNNCGHESVVSEAYTNHTKYRYCKKCFDTFKPCDNCKKICPPMRLYKIGTENQQFCSDCVNLLAYGCERCSGYFLKSDAKNLDGYLYCDACYNYHVGTCEICERNTRKSQMTRVRIMGEAKLICRNHKIVVCYDCNGYVCEDKPCEHLQKKVKKVR